jgi:hypothetical protein
MSATNLSHLILINLITLVTYEPRTADKGWSSISAAWPGGGLKRLTVEAPEVLSCVPSS